jgi:hypothetical protein
VAYITYNINELNPNLLAVLSDWEGGRDVRNSHNALELAKLYVLWYLKKLNSLPVFSSSGKAIVSMPKLLPVRQDAPVRVYNAYPLDGHVAFPLSPSIYSPPGFWSYAWSPCIVCTCYIRPVIAVDNCFNFRSPSTAVGYCDCRKVCEEDWDNPATWPQWIDLPYPSPLPRPSPRPSPLPLPFPLPLGDPLPKIEVYPEIVPLLDPDTLIQPLRIPSPQRFIVRPSVRPDVEVPPDVDFEFPPDPEIEVVVEISPEELISPINWIITQEIASTAPLTDAISEAIRD